MSGRPCQRARLENGLKLDLNRLARRGFIQLGGYRTTGISWTNAYTGELVASGLITADMTITNGLYGWFRIQIGSLDQRIHLTARPRHFGGHQWYFHCLRANRLASVVWKPPGARDFACRQAWRGQVAYNSQFSTPVDRAHQGKAKINARLCSIGGLDPGDWDFPPKPKWMRWSTYNRAEEKFDRYEGLLDMDTAALIERILGR